MSLATGTLLDRRYRILALLGEGGMGSVYKAEDTRLPGRFVAIKELLADSFPTPQELQEALKRFSAEAELLGRLSNPDIPRVTDQFPENGQHYFIMDFIAGKSLESIINHSVAQANKQPLPEAQVAGWMSKVCKILTYIHSQKPAIIMRDLKPGNIMITPEEEVKLIDFGIARRFDPTKKTNTENLGTITYASPEHLGQTGQTDARSDIYSLGATMYHLLTLQEPEPLTTPPPGDLRRKNPLISPQMERIIIKSMDLVPSNRFQSAAEMAQALAACLPAGASSGVASTTGAAQQPRLSTPPAQRNPPPPSTAGSSSSSSTTVRGPICPVCGYVNRPGAKFCAQDRTRLIASPPSTPSSSARSSAPPPARPSSGVAPATVGTGRGSPIISGAATPAISAAQGRYQQGVDLLNRHEFVPAAQAIAQAITQGYRRYEAYFNLGIAYRQAKQINEAITQFRNAQSLQRTAEVSFQLGLCYREMGAPYSPQAIAMFSEAQRINPGDLSNYYQLGTIYLEQQQYQRAEQEFDNGLRIDPHHYTLHLYLGKTYNSQQKWTEARRELDMAAGIVPQAAAPWLELGKSYQATQDFNQALEDYKQAKQLEPNNVDVYIQMAKCYRSMNNKREAKRALDTARHLAPTHPEIIQMS